MPLSNQQKKGINAFNRNAVSPMANYICNLPFVFRAPPAVLIFAVTDVLSSVIPIFLWVLAFLCGAAKMLALCFNSHNEALGSSLLSNGSRISSIRLNAFIAALVRYGGGVNLRQDHFFLNGSVCSLFLR